MGKILSYILISIRRMKFSNDREWLGERLLLVMWLVQRIKVRERKKRKKWPRKQLPVVGKPEFYCG